MAPRGLWLAAGLGLGWVADQLLGDPRRLHPVAGFGQVAEALEAGDTVAVFPEGTTSDGTTLLPFHANLLQAAIATQTPVQPVALRYADRDHPVSAAAAYVGDTTLLASVWRVACANGLEVRVAVLPARGTRHMDRRALAHLVRADIAGALEMSALEHGPREEALASP